MSVQAEIDGKHFSFPDGWQVLKYDDSVFHRRQFQTFAGGSKAVDAVALSPAREVWLIEVKDYQRTRRKKPTTVFAEVASKVQATLAGLATARVRASKDDERDFAGQAMQGKSIRIALHLDQPRHPSRLFPNVVDPRTATAFLQREVRAVDPHAICYGCGGNVYNIPWSVEHLQEQNP